jgi:hypothetical protein
VNRKVRLAALAACLTAPGFQQRAPALAKGDPGAASLAEQDHPTKASPSGTSGAAGTTENQGGGGGGPTGSPSPMASSSPEETP